MIEKEIMHIKEDLNLLSFENEFSYYMDLYSYDKQHTDTEFLIGFNIYLTLYYKFIAQEKKEEIRFYNLFTSRNSRKYLVYNAKKTFAEILDKFNFI